LAIAAALGLGGSPDGSARAGETPVTGEESGGAQDLYLEVIINGRKTGRIASFLREPGGAFTSTPDSLRDAGLLPPAGAGAPDEAIPLASLPGISFRYDEAGQTIEFTAPDAALNPQVVAVRAPGEAVLGPDVTTWGAFANYSLVSAFGSDGDFDRADFEGLSGGFDAHFSTPAGVLDSSAVVRVGPEFDFEAQRLETAWTTYDVERMLTYRAGDSISGGVAWTRPVTFGGLQIQRDFSVRPDLITRPLPSFQGSAAVPTTVEVYTNNIRTYSGDVDPGPFVIEDIPGGTGANTATVVLRDFLGRETTIDLPFYGSQRLLTEGLYDFSLEAGFPRRSLGTKSFDYDSTPFGSMTLRYGVTDSITAEAHVEASDKHVNGGVGGAFLLGSSGVATAALAGSTSDGGTGGLASAGLEVDIFGITAFARTQRTFGDYDDIASVSARRVTIEDELLDARPPKALDQIGLSFALPVDPTRFSLNYTHREASDGDSLQIGSLTVSRPLGGGAYFHLTGSALFDDGRDYSLFASVTFPLGDNHRATTGTTQREDEFNVFAEVSRPAQRQPGNVGWLVGTTQGSDQSLYGNVVYHAPVAQLGGAFDLDEDGVRGTAHVDGAVVLAGGGVFLSPRIYDAFAVVDAGLPDVDVFHENRLVGQTGSGGRIVVPNIRSFQANRISIDPNDLPLAASASTAREIASALPRGGVVVDFDIDAATSAALVSFVDAFGNPVEVGSGAILAGSDEIFVVGYDGETYLENLDMRNRVTITRPDRTTCAAEFEFDPGAPLPVRIDAVPCIPR
jgi:outer membrane usher protein